MPDLVVAVPVFQKSKGKAKEALNRRFRGEKLTKSETQTVTVSTPYH